MKTKKFLLATSGTTVDGRNISESDIQEMASSYDPKTYGARVNIEHIRGLRGDSEFKAYGDVLELSAEEVTVNFNGTDEKRIGLYGVFDVSDDAKALNDAGQKVYPSIEIFPNFGDKGFAYLAGCALTDSPACIGTDRMEFNRTMPGTLQQYAAQSGIAAAVLEFAEDKTDDQEKVGGLVEAMTGFFSKFGGGQTDANPAAPAPAPVAPPADAPAAFDMAAFTAVMTEFAEKTAAEIADVKTTITENLHAERVRIDALAAQMDATPAAGQGVRPAANGGNFTATDC